MMTSFVSLSGPLIVGAIFPDATCDAPCGMMAVLLVIQSVKVKKT
jgi:hypothetical protein